MKLLSHNHLLCLNKECKCNHPLFIEPKKVIQIESEPKLSFMVHILSMINYGVLVAAAKQIGMGDLPQALPSQEVMESSESFLRSMQKVLLDTNVVEGTLTCSECHTFYVIANGVVDMMHPQKNVKQQTEQNTTAANDSDDASDNANEEDEDVDGDMNAFLDDHDSKQRHNDEHTNQDMVDID